MIEEDLLQRVAENEKKIDELSKYLKEQVEKYTNAHKISEVSVSIKEDEDNVRDCFIDFYKQSKNFVDALVDIRKNTLYVISKFPDLESWLGPSNEDDWEGFLNDVTVRPKKSKE